MVKVRSLPLRFVFTFVAVLAICVPAGVFRNESLTNHFRLHTTPGSRAQTGLQTPVNTDAVVSTQDNALRAGRPLFPYSVIPGGIGSRGELANAIANDPVVAAHYAGFHVSGARIVTLSAPRSAYVSYRIGDQIFWTAKRVFLPKNEAVITDGAVEARARCGNQISAVPRLPTSSREPLAEAMENRNLEPAPAELPLNARVLPNLLPEGEYLFEGEGPRFFRWPTPPILLNPPIIPVVPIPPPNVPPPPVPPPAPPIGSPEPGTGIVVILAFAAWGLFAAVRKGAH